MDTTGKKARTERSTVRLSTIVVAANVPFAGDTPLGGVASTRL
jgi:hypothetical protein